MRTPGSRGDFQLCHINMLKKYHWLGVSPLPTCSTLSPSKSIECDFQDCNWLPNAEMVSTLKTKLSHLGQGQATQVLEMLSLHCEVFGSVPGRTKWIQHDDDVSEAASLL